MSEYSREYCQAKGFGSVGIARIDNKCKLMFPVENDEIEFVDFQEFQNNFQK